VREAGAICKLVINPTNPAEVFVAALGHPFGKNPERGIFRTRDGGATWQHVMALNDSTGSVSIVMRDRDAVSRTTHARARLLWQGTASHRERGDKAEPDGIPR
jgi:hypothetical protein